MRFAIYSDVHGNLHAFEAVLADIGKAKLMTFIASATW